MKSDRLVGALALSVFLTFSFGTAVSAQDDAHTLFQRGQVAYTQGDYAAAIEQWNRAFALDPRPLLQWNLAQAFERLGRLEEAAAALNNYLEHADPADVNQADARARMGSIRARIESTGVVLHGGPDGATVLLDGTDVGRLPRPDAIHVSAGSHRIVVRAPGFADFTSTVVVPAGQQSDVPVDMTAAVAARTSDGGDIPIVPVIMWSAAGVTLVTAAILGGVALSSAGSAPASTGPEADSARGLALGSDVMFGVSAACAITALILTIVMPSGSHAETATARLTRDGFALTF